MRHVLYLFTFQDLFEHGPLQANPNRPQVHLCASGQGARQEVRRQSDAGTYVLH